MKNSSAYAKKLTKFLKTLRGKPDAAAFPKLDPVTQIVVGFLQWNATRKLAETAHRKLMDSLVDNNEVRVSHPSEVALILGERYPRVWERAGRLHDVLQDVFDREHAVTLEVLEKKSKKDIREYLTSLPGMTQYVAGQVMLLCFGTHAIPIDDTTAELLMKEGVVEAGASVEAIAGFIERHVKGGDAEGVHTALRAWTDSQFIPATASRGRGEKAGVKGLPKGAGAAGSDRAKQQKQKKAGAKSLLPKKKTKGR